MTTVEQSEYGVGTAVAEGSKRPRWSGMGDTWWRHLVGILALIFALFPVWFVLSSAFNPAQSIDGSQLIPTHITLQNFRDLFNTNLKNVNVPTAHYVRWYVNSLIIPGVAAIFSVALGAFAAYAFSRFRFTGRRFGMLGLLLIQMFPQILLVVAIYLILLQVGNVFPAFGLNTRTGLILVYLGGAMGVNTWLMKGFFDTIPKELDESAKVDGATPNQIFWGVILPLSIPILTVVALISFIFTLNEFAIASTVLQTTDKQTLPVGLRVYIDKQYGNNWGPFAAGALLAAIPVTALFLGLQKFIVGGLTQGSVKG
jgi:arabinogalactan oligomer / maltooligosaccharide transport system permease protein